VPALVSPRSRERVVVTTETRETRRSDRGCHITAPSKAAPTARFSRVKSRRSAKRRIYARTNGYVRRWLVDIGAQVGQASSSRNSTRLRSNATSRKAAPNSRSRSRAGARTTTAKRWTEMLAAKTISLQETDEKVADLALKKATVEAAGAKSSAARRDARLQYKSSHAPLPGL